uniref:Uncharacterized protein n=1 Tax=Triticum urartu TaxID=4572 RepID=A0A8R7QH63_TRIUA
MQCAGLAVHRGAEAAVGQVRRRDPGLHPQRRPCLAWHVRHSACRRARLRPGRFLRARPGRRAQLPGQACAGVAARARHRRGRRRGGLACARAEAPPLHPEEKSQEQEEDGHGDGGSGGRCCIVIVSVRAGAGGPWSRLPRGAAHHVGS